MFWLPVKIDPIPVAQAHNQIDNALDRLALPEFALAPSVWALRFKGGPHSFEEGRFGYRW